MKDFIGDLSNNSGINPEIIPETFQNISETFWNSLDKQQQLQVFCAVIRRLYEGKLERNGTYRYVLYDVFGFGPDAYRKAQEAGFLAISNAIVPDDYDKELLEYFCGKYLGTDQNVLLEAYARYVLDDLEGLLKDITDG